MIKNGFKRTRTGIALLLVIGILGLLSLVGISFALNMLLMRKEANNYLNSVKARYIAEAGIKRAIMDIRGQVAAVSYNNLKTYINNYVAASGTNVAFAGGRYTLAITSEEDKVNLNTFDETDAAQLTILRTFLSDQQIANIIDYRDVDTTVNTAIGASTGNIEGTVPCKDRPFDSINEIRAATGINQTAFDNNRNLLTISKPIIRGGLLGKYYSDWNTFSNGTILSTVYYKGKVVELGNFEEHYIEGADGDGDQDSGYGESHDAEFAGGSLVGTSAKFGLDKFGVVWEGYLEILPAEAGNPITFRIRADDGIRFFIDGTDILGGAGWKDQSQQPGYAANYTFSTPGWHRIRIDYYDNAGENALNLKWGGSDWDTASFVLAERFGYDPPTESGTYNSAGNYTVTCTAEVLKTGQIAAQKIISGIIKVFGTWTQTTKEEFYAAWFNDYAVGVPNGYLNSDGALPPAIGDNYRDGEMRNVTWLDSCPLNATDNLEASGYFSDLNDATKFKRDSLKLGFWVDGDRDPGYTASMLKALVRSEKWGIDNWINVTRDDGVAHDFFWISYGDVRDDWPIGAPNGNNELVIKTSWHEARRFEVDPFYYFPSQSNPNLVSGQPNVFMRGWTAVDPVPGSEAKAYWKGNGVELVAGPPGSDFEGFDGSGNPSGAKVYAGIPASGGIAYTGDGSTGYGYDADGDGLYDIDLTTDISERICKVWPAGSHAQTDIKAIYNATRYYIENQTNPYNYWQPDVPFTTPMIYACGERMDSVSGSGFGQGSTGFGLLTKDNDTYWDNINGRMMGWTYPEDQDILELTLDSSTGSSPPYNNRVYYNGSNFKVSSVLAIIGSGGNYVGWQKAPAFNRMAPQNFPTAVASATVSVPNFQFLSRNVYDANDAWNVGQDWPKWMVPNVYQGAKWLGRTGGNADQLPANLSDNTGMTTFWDNIRIIPESGFLVSAPHVARSSTDADVRWGTVSWTEDKPANTDLKIYLRSAAANLPTSDTFSALYTNGAQIGGVGRVIQYKVALSSTAFNPTVVWVSSGGITPRLDDITITYIPAISVLYWKEGP